MPERPDMISKPSRVNEELDQAILLSIPLYYCLSSLFFFSGPVVWSSIVSFLWSRPPSAPFALVTGPQLSSDKHLKECPLATPET